MKTKLFSVTASDCQWDYFTVGGHGGSGKDTSNTGVRVRHPPSGAMGVGRDERSQLKNRRAAFRRMAESNAFKAWVKRTAAGLSEGPSVEELVEKAMEPKNLKIEIRKDGTWEEQPLDKRQL